MSETLDALRDAGARNNRAGALLGYLALAWAVSGLASFALANDLVSLEGMVPEGMGDFSKNPDGYVAVGAMAVTTLPLALAFVHMWFTARAVDKAADADNIANPGFRMGHL